MTKKGNEELESWLLRLLKPRLNLRFFELTYEGVPVVILEIPRAPDRPVQFSGLEYIRIGSYQKLLRDNSQIERELWRIFDAMPFESMKVAERLTGQQVLELLDYPGYFTLLRQPLPSDRDMILERLEADRIVIASTASKWDITNLGAILLARNLDDFRHLGRKALRVILYRDKGRRRTIREQVGRKGYATGFEGLVDYVDALLPRNEVIGKAFRQDVPMYPEIAIRELIANALIHQDFSITGSGPMIEIFEDRMEITSPGVPLMDPRRFLDSPPRSRNETLASFMRRIGVCEERGSGIDKVVFETEFYQLPAPVFEVWESATRVILFAYKSFKEMDRSDRVRACYLHACLRYVENGVMTNSSLRERFGIAEHNSATVSRIIRDTMDDGLVKPYDPEQGKKYARYLPFWA